jgi:hypothetical protein
MTTTNMTGTKGYPEAYSIPNSTQALLLAGILNNPIIAPTLPREIAECAAPTRFIGTSLPSIPIKRPLAESISALKGLEAAMINVLLKGKYGLPPQEAVIDTDHAQLFFMSILLNTLDPKTATNPDGENIYFAAMLTPSRKAVYEK